MIVSELVHLTENDGLRSDTTCGLLPDPSNFGVPNPTSMGVVSFQNALFSKAVLRILFLFLLRRSVPHAQGGVHTRQASAQEANRADRTAESSAHDTRYVSRPTRSGGRVTVCLFRAIWRCRKAPRTRIPEQPQGPEATLPLERSSLPKGSPIRFQTGPHCQDRHRMEPDCQRTAVSGPNLTRAIKCKAGKAVQGSPRG